MNRWMDGWMDETESNFKPTFFSCNRHNAWSAIPFSILCKGRHVNAVRGILLKIRDVYSFCVTTRENQCSIVTGVAQFFYNNNVSFVGAIKEVARTGVLPPNIQVVVSCVYHLDVFWKEGCL